MEARVVHHGLLLQEEPVTVGKGIPVPGPSSSTGLSLVELLVSIAILSMAVGLFAQVASYAFSHRSSVEKRTESHGFTQSTINSLYNVTFDELVGICSATGALDESPSDPCVNSSGVLIENQNNTINTTNLNSKQISIVKILDSRLQKAFSCPPFFGPGGSRRDLRWNFLSCAQRRS